MACRTELRAPVAEELGDLLEAHFHELPDNAWGLMRRAPGDPLELFGYFADAGAADAAAAELRARFPQLADVRFEAREIRDEDWQNAYKDHIREWRDRSLRWIPLWQKESTDAPTDAAVVYLDAGMAFGTGSHETSRLCARRLLDYRERPARPVTEASIIDAGCGSGILALSAAALGFRRIHAFDHDPEAIPVCHANTAENPHIPLAGDTFAVADLEAGLSARGADLLLANIQTHILLPNADPLLRALNPGGHLVLSGILGREIGEVRDHFEARCRELHGGFAHSDSRADGEWADLLLVR